MPLRRGGHGPSQGPGCPGHAFVVGDNPGEAGTELTHPREVNGVEAA